MAKRKEGFDVTGLTIEDVMRLDINMLNERQLRQVTSRLVSAGNKRIRRLEASDVAKSSPALKQVKESGGTFSVQHKNINELRSEFSRARTFLKLKTSTARGTRKVQNQLFKELGIRRGEMTKEQVATFWDMLHKLKQSDPNFVKEHYEQVKKEIGEIVINKPTLTPDEILVKLKGRIDELYIEEQGNITDDQRSFIENFFASEDQETDEF